MIATNGFRVGGAFALALACVPGVAAAQDHVLVGPGVVVAPAYEGADTYRVLPIPLLDIVHGRLFLDTVDGLGIDIVQAGPVTLGTSIAYVPGYRQRDAPAGIGGLADTAGGRLFATWRSNGIRLTVGGTRSIGGTHGTTADATLAYTAALGPRLSLTPSAATTWADSKANDRYFGIDAPQAQASGLDDFAPGSGFRDVTAGLTARYTMSRHWVLIANASATGLPGRDADSPIVAHRWRPLGSLGVGYVL